MKIYYFAFESIFDPIFDSQVVGFFKKINDRSDFSGNRNSLIVAGSIRDLFRKAYRQKKKSIKEKLNGRCIFFFKFPYFYRFQNLLRLSLVLNAVVCFFMLFFVLRMKRKDSAVCQCRTEMGAYILLKLKKFYYKNIKVICDCRGIGSKEILYKPGIRKKALLSAKIREIERYVYSESDYLFCVTRAFKEYILNENKKKVKKIRVIPCCLDVNKFKYDPILRKKVRQEMGIKSSDFVVLYSGSLNEWQLPSRMMEIFKIIRGIIKNSIFVMLTRDLKNAQSLFIGSGLKEKSFIISFKPYNIVSKYLLAGDIGLLIREDNDVNRVAFPVKFSEYIRCGVPVLSSISSDVMDLVRDYGLGYRLKNFNNDGEVKKVSRKIKEDIAYIKSDEYKKKISKIIGNRIDWDNYITSVVEIYKGLVSNNQ